MINLHTKIVNSYNYLNKIKMKYNIMQIIKSDIHFIENINSYFPDGNNNIEFTINTAKKSGNMYLYFDDLNNLTAKNRATYYLKVNYLYQYSDFQGPATFTVNLYSYKNHLSKMIGDGVSVARKPTSSD